MYHQLVVETLAFVRAQDKKTLFVSAASHAFFGVAKKQEVKKEIQIPLKSFVPPSTKPKVEKVETAPKAPPPPIEDPLHSLLQRIAPQVKLSTEVPSDREAKRIANAWKQQALAAPVSLLYFGKNGKEGDFLRQVAKAIQDRWMPAQVIEDPTLDWEFFLKAPQLKWLIAADPLPQELKCFYRENITSGAKFLGDIPLISISQPALYLQNPLEKRALWNTLTSLLSS